MDRGSRVLAMVCSAALAWLLTSIAAAQPAAWLEVSPGLSCLSAERLEGLVAMWLGKPHVATDVRVHVRGDAQRARLVELTITRDGATSQRVFDPVPAGCDEAHAAVSLVIALAIEPDVLASVVPSQRQPEAEPLEVALTVQVASASALLPSWSLGLTAGVEVWPWPWLGARAELLAQHARNSTVAETAGTFDATLVAGDLRGCAGGRPSRRMRLALCTGAALGALHAQGRGYAESYSPTGLWLGITSGVRLDVDAGLPWVLDVTAVLPLRSQPFTVARSGQDEATEQPGTAALLVGLGARFAL